MTESLPNFVFHAEGEESFNLAEFKQLWPHNYKIPTIGARVFFSKSARKMKALQSEGFKWVALAAYDAARGVDDTRPVCAGVFCMLNGLAGAEIARRAHV